MPVSRQQDRHARFRAAFAEMPLWEVWEDERPAPTDTDPDATKLVRNCAGISRTVRRDMARKFSVKQWKEERCVEAKQV